MIETFPCVLCGLNRPKRNLYVVLIRGRGAVRMCVWCVSDVKMDTAKPWVPFTNRNEYINEKMKRGNPR